MRLSRAVVVLLCFTAPAQTFIVDVNNGPGTNFTSIATAVAAVPDGSVLIVRVGHYASIAVTGKSLAVLGEAGGASGPFVTFGETLTGSITISGLAANQRVVMRGLRSSLGQANGQALVSCQNCQGSILLDAVAQGPLGSLRLEVGLCRQVQVTNCLFTCTHPGVGQPHGASIMASDVMLVDSSFTSGVPLSSLQQPGPGLQQVGGRVQVLGCLLRGGPGYMYGGHGVLMQGGDLRILRGSTVAGGLGWPPFDGLAIAGSGSVRRDPAAVLSGQAPLVAPGVTLTTMGMPDVRAAGGQLGFPATSTMYTPSGTLGVLLFGIPDAPLFVPGWTDPLWVTGAVVTAFGASPWVSGNVAVPNNPSLIGQCFGWQGLSIDLATFAFQVSNAAWFVLRP